MAQATPLNVGNGIRISADISTLQDADYYQLGACGIIHSSSPADPGVSLLQGRITVYKNGQAISTMSPSDINQNIKILIPNIDGNATYTIKVESGTGDVFGIGSYRLVVKPTTSTDPTGDATIAQADITPTTV